MEGWGSTFLPDIDSFIQNYTVSQPRNNSFYHPYFRVDTVITQFPAVMMEYTALASVLFNMLQNACVL
jgi:hypothetical protein